MSKLIYFLFVTILIFSFNECFAMEVWMTPEKAKPFLLDEAEEAVDQERRGEKRKYYRYYDGDFDFYLTKKPRYRWDGRGYGRIYMQQKDQQDQQ